LEDKLEYLTHIDYTPQSNNVDTPTIILVPFEV